MLNIGCVLRQTDAKYRVCFKVNMDEISVVPYGGNPRMCDSCSAIDS
jgi:hypothetical protein